MTVKRHCLHAGIRALTVGAVLVFFRVMAQAADRFEGGMAGFLFPSSNAIDYTLHDSPGSKSDPMILENRIRGNFIVSKSETDTWSVKQSAGEFHLDRPSTIPGNGLSLPQTLYEVETGGAYQHRMGDRRDWGFGTSVGSASDRLFHSIHETTFRATGSYHIPSRTENSWLFLLSYSNNRHFANNIPFPGAAYLIHSEARGLDAAIGIPFFFLNYRPTPLWNARVSVFGPDNLSTELGYRLWGLLQTYGGFEWGQQEWLPAGRADNSTRLFYDQKRWAIGLRFPMAKWLRADLSANYEFNRRLYENDKSVNRGIPEIDLSPGWAFLGKLSTRW